MKSREEWLSWNERNVIEVRNTLKKAIRNGFPQKYIEHGAGIEKGKLSRWINGKTSWLSVKEQQFAKIAELLIDEGLIKCLQPRLSAHEYNGLRSFICQSESIDDMSKAACGDYIAYRYSNSKKGHILVGTLKIIFNKKLNIIETMEQYSSVINNNTHTWDRTGYFFCKGDKNFAIFSRKIGSFEPQIIYLEATINRRRIKEMDGIVYDFQGQDFYLTKVYFKRTSSTLEPCDVLPDNVEPEVRSKLEGRLHWKIENVLLGERDDSQI